MTLLDFDASKAAIRAALWAFHRATRTAEEIAFDLEHTPDEAARVLNRALLDTAAMIQREHQARMVREVGQFLLWVSSKDTAYRDARDWFLHTAMQGLAAARIPAPRPPGAWYINLYERAVDEQRARARDGLALPEEREHEITLEVE